MELKKGDNKDQWWVKVPLRLYEAEWTTPYTIAVYGALASYADFKNSKNGAHPSLAQIAARSKVSRRQVCTELQRMATHGCITWDKGHSGWGNRKANSYVLHWAPGGHSGDQPTSAGDALVHRMHSGSAGDALRVVHPVHTTENHFTENHNLEGRRGALSSRGLRHIDKDPEPVWTGKPDKKLSQTPSSDSTDCDF